MDNEDDTQYGCDKRHDHIGPWWVIGALCVALFVLSYAAFMVEQHQFDTIYDRVGEMQRQIECPPGELLVADHDGVEYCLDPAEQEETP